MNTGPKASTTVASIAAIPIIFICVAALATEPLGVHWPGFRGSGGSGVAEKFSTPTSWNVEGSENIKWMSLIAGLGHSSPVIWDDRIYITTAISGEKDSPLKVGLYGDVEPVDDESVHEWRVYCLDKNTGEILWKQTAHRGVPKIKRHPKATHANCTPATDGKFLVAFFGSEGLFCYNMDGTPLWKRDLGTLDSGFFYLPEAQWGFASSPVIHQNTVIVQCDVQKNSFIAAFKIEDGESIWKVPRDEVPTWSTPAIHESEGKTQVVVNGYKHIGGYDFETGHELWKLGGGGDIPVPTPVFKDNVAFITNAHGRMSPIYAISLDARGDISPGKNRNAGNNIVWSYDRGGAYMQTPIVYGDYLYSCRDNGVLSCYKTDTGERIYEKRLGRGATGFTASPVAADGKIYFTSEVGDVYVIKAGPEFNVLATNPMGDICMATPAISEGTLFFRTRNHLIAVSEN
ncbi:MAG: PQQ-binding-like beta-propeller repeat protein [Candidatus Poribacteria bacterium]|nr:PQQ-binding-like beta-propeller repeat protein [Candidatus Poribacteria bacterium]